MLDLKKISAIALGKKFTSKYHVKLYLESHVT